MSKNLELVIRDFVLSKSCFKLIESINVGGAHSTSSVSSSLCILDSSFNPPTIAHYVLAQNALNHYYKSSNVKPSLLLLLATSNADKRGQSPEQYAHRVGMMKKMVEHMSKNCAANDIHIGITSHAKFIDKLDAIKENAHIFPRLPDKLVFLVGFDTLIRIIDPKYYDPTLPLEHTLGPLMTRAGFFCLIRFPDPISMGTSPSPQNASIEDQLELIDKIKTGQLKGIPSEWADNIVIAESTSGSTEGISSSLARKLVQEGKDISSILLPEVAGYVVDNGLYR